MEEKHALTQSMFSSKGVFIGSQYYRVTEFPYKIINTNDYEELLKNVAYHYHNTFADFVLLYRGKVDSAEALWSVHTNNYAPGIYYVRESKDSKRIVIRFPVGKAEKETYSAKNIVDIQTAVLSGEYAASQFLPATKVGSTATGDVFEPPIYHDDDANSLLMKVAITAKQAPFDLYGRRIEADATDRGAGVEGTNRKNNYKRALITNRRMTMDKYIQLANVYDLKSATIIMDTTGSVDPVFGETDEKKAIIIYHNSEPFEIDMSKVVLVDGFMKDQDIHFTEDDESEDDD